MAESILEKFLILFESNAKDVEQGNKQAEESTNKLQNSLNNANTAAHHLGRSFVAIARSALEAYAVIFSVGKGFEAITGIVEFGDHLGRMSESLGVSVSDLSAWTDATRIAGGSSDGFLQSIDNLNTGLAQIDVTGHSRMKPFFDELHIDMERMGDDGKKHIRPVLDLLPEIAERFEHMSKQSSKAFGRKLGFDEGTILLLQKGKTGLEEIIEEQKRLGGYTQADTDAMKDFNDSWIKFEHKLRTDVLPTVTKVISGLSGLINSFGGISDWVDNHADVVNAFFITLGAIIWATVVPATLAWAAATIAATWPILLLITLTALLAYGIIKLGEVIGDWADQAGDALDEIIDWFDKLWGKVKRVADWIGDKMWDVVYAIKDAWNWLADQVDKAIDRISSRISQLRKDYPIIAFALAHNPATALGAYNNIHDIIGYGKKQLGIASATKLNSLTSSSITNGGSQSNVTKASNVNIGEINIQTKATDSYEIAGHIKDNLNYQMRHANSSFDDGVAY